MRTLRLPLKTDFGASINFDLAARPPLGIRGDKKLKQRERFSLHPYKYSARKRIFDLSLSVLYAAAFPAQIGILSTADKACAAIILDRLKAPCGRRKLITCGEKSVHCTHTAF
jgi:hypothetical protein